jgi:hypothetical protein
VDVNVQVSSEDTCSFENMNTRIGITAGVDDSISKQSLGENLPEYSCAYFKFKTENPSSVAESLESTVESLKEFLGEINEDLAPLIEQLEINVLTLDDGAAIVVNLDSHPVLSPYVQMASMSAQPVKEFDPKVTLQIGMSKSLTDESIVGGDKMLRFNVNTKSVVDALLNNNVTALSKDMEAKLHGAVKQKMGIEVSALLSLINAKSLNLSLEMYKADPEKISLKFSPKAKFEEIVPKLQENPMFGVLQSMEFIKELVDTLKENNVSELNIGVSLGGVHARVELAMDVGFVFDAIFAEEE